MQTALEFMEPGEGSNGESLPKFLSASEVASRLDVTPQTVYRWAKVGILPVHRLGPRTLRFEEQDLEALMVPHLPEEASNVPQERDLLDALADRIIRKLKQTG